MKFDYELEMSMFEDEVCICSKRKAFTLKVS